MGPIMGMSYLYDLVTANEFKKTSNKHFDTENFTPTSIYRPTLQMGSTWYTSDLHVVTNDI
jgi:hypothetical protein